MWRKPVERTSTGLWGASTVMTARNGRTMRRMERHFGSERVDAARRHRDAQRAEAQRRRAYAGRSPHRRAVTGEWVEDALGALWTALWRRGR